MTSGINGEDAEWFEIMQAFPAHSGPLSTWNFAPLNWNGEDHYLAFNLTFRSTPNDTSVTNPRC